MARPEKQETSSSVTASSEGGTGRLVLAGTWTVETCQARSDELGSALQGLNGAGAVEVDLAGIGRFDTAGAWLVHRTAARLKEAGREVRLRDLSENQRILLEEVGENAPGAPQPPRQRSFGRELVEGTGETVISSYRDVRELVVLLGQTTLIGFGLMRHPGQARYTSLIFHLEQIGLRAVPIVVLISLLIGGIIEQQGVYQLRGFGAEIYSVDLAGILILRELGVLLTSIMVAGRTGSAITAEIGSMKMREEIDAMRTLALSPTAVLIMPRLTALMISLPLLTFVSNMACLVGAGLTAWVYIDLPPQSFISHLRTAIDLNTFLVGMIKAPFMAVAIGFIACREGLAVEGSAESLGARTTASVVKAIFTVIVLDGFFAMFFSAMDI
ncbi:ABC transporter permease [Lutibaculum baratangense]|uniref:ABC-type transport system involved in resistance to organic solvent, permease component USSDB6A n=1 Tax=Lutibaculum baratangense AMV1 TaxID=631454 RepID=V4RFT4_9HYPH|nr:ABC transporter permease [Lutibaculum baratangense]ESR24239.1 ABC-type transport system involved in resistance to organic solvent, permease component USSDB6A [Lutibaculum baratangense AMV1]